MMYRERLQSVKSFVEDIYNKDNATLFYIKYWHVIMSENSRLCKKLKIAQPYSFNNNECMCVLGNFCESEQGRAEGLSLKLVQGFKMLQPTYTSSNKTQFYGWKAIQNYFIKDEFHSNEDKNALFFAFALGNYVTANNVLIRIDHVIKNNTRIEL